MYRFLYIYVLALSANSYSLRQPSFWNYVNSVTFPSIQPKTKNIEQLTSIHQVKKSSSIFSSLVGLGLSAPLVEKIVGAGNRVASLDNIPPGTQFQVTWHNQNLSLPKNIEVYKSKENHVVIKKHKKSSWLAYNVQRKIDIETEIYEGTIDTNLWESGKKAGMADSLIRRLVNSFAWQIDFNREVLVGDRWQLLAEKKFVEGEFIGFGKILAAVYQNGNTKYKGIWYKPHRAKKGQMFSMQGISLKGMFLKSPLKVSRITSRFRKKRFHPILKKIRPHLGVDYAAAPGTPIMAVGNGTVSYKGKSRASGNMIKIRHNNTYKTAYLHLQKFPKGLKKGSKISQGQIIGYVGSTGYATGPHLHFAFYIKNKYVDPLGKRFPSETTLKGKNLSKFKKYARSILGKF